MKCLAVLHTQSHPQMTDRFLGILALALMAARLVEGWVSSANEEKECDGDVHEDVGGGHPIVWGCKAGSRKEWKIKV